MKIRRTLAALLIALACTSVSFAGPIIFGVNNFTNSA